MIKRNESLDALRGFAILTMVLSGAVAYGDVLPAWMFHAQVPPPEHKFNPAIPGITWVDLVFLFFLFSMGAAIPLSLKKYIEVMNVFGLFARVLFVNLLVSAALCAAAFYLLRNEVKDSLYKQLVQAGTYLLLLGLFFEAYEGGIKKDSSTYSYYFVSSGLAFFILVLFSVMTKRKYFFPISHYFSLNGKNPIVAYVAGNLVVLPLLALTQTKPHWDAMNQNFFMGLMKGILFTGLVSAITIFFVKRRWFWKS